MEFPLKTLSVLLIKIQALAYHSIQKIPTACYVPDSKQSSGLVVEIKMNQAESSFPKTPV